MITIDNITIRQDDEERYCLNDLHKVAGGERRHEPLNEEMTMSNVQLFNFKSNQIRVVEIEGNPWFVAADVCRSIGYAVRPNGTTHASLVRSILGEDETFTTQTGKTGRPSLCISESGLYKLVMRSDKPEARRFQDWVTKEVLPAIRKDGGYIMGEEKVKTGESPCLWST